MKVAYVACFDQPNSADDEGAIVYALEQLGHTVNRLHESRGRVAHRLKGDFLLFHHWQDYASLSKVQIPKVFWTFDLITYPDPTLAARNRTRVEWIRQITDRADLGFMTDGDAVARDTTGKLHWLPQGADERKVGMGVARLSERIPILFTGIRKGGLQRQSFVDEMRAKYLGKFCHIEKGMYGRDLANMIAAADIVVAPDAPVSDRYFSNRVFNVLGFGGFLLHPWSLGLASHYAGWSTAVGSKELVFYSSREELHDHIDYYLDESEQRREIAQAGAKRTLTSNLYRHRVERLIKTVKKRLL